MTSSDRTSLDGRDLSALARRVGSWRDVAEPGPARVAFVCAKFNGAVTAALLEGALDELERRTVDLRTVSVTWVPGAFELPLAARHLATGGGADAVVALGAVIRGDTPHFDFVAGQCAQGLQEVQLSTGVPTVFGVLTCDSEEQAWQRAGRGGANKGAEAAVAALEMAALVRAAERA
jgi:6,7-dimethyl-8-ribityllumazine synthase